RIRYNSKDPFGEIVGVVEDIKYDGLHSADSAHLYEPYQQNAWPFLTITLRSQLDQSALIAAVQREVRSLDPNLPVSNVSTMGEVRAVAPLNRGVPTTICSSALIPYTVAATSLSLQPSTSNPPVAGQRMGCDGE